MIVGLILSYLVAKLISMVICFRQDRLKVVIEKEPVGETPEADQALEEVNKKHAEVQNSLASDSDNFRVKGYDFEGFVMEQSLLGEDDDDWEGIKSIEPVGKMEHVNGGVRNEKREERVGRTEMKGAESVFCARGFVTHSI
ncbi:hypothetical protein KFK09_024065 [Dendrobium nobile]|uniref:Uncharacterized protein n=1 Tax=Dendrobium nobile TaxID=94219 RepID=A0A8T3ACV0_DENNO|nr:hypothetical protein KFK09_024065 [Dendrobium nobile]